MLYLRTIQSLRWQQVAYRLLRAAQRRSPRDVLKPGLAAEDRLPALAGALAANRPEAIEMHLAVADDVLAGRFSFLGRGEIFPDGAIPWTTRPVSHLWSYHLHYFDYAVSLAWAFRETGDARHALRFEALSSDWIRRTSHAGGDGWSPYATSVRLINWSRALLLFGEALGRAPRTLLVHSMHAQAAFLERRLEWHVLANHLQKNLTALATAGLVLAGTDAARWLSRGTRMLWDEVGEQVLDDGGHYERSPMYHALATADLLELIALLRASDVEVPPFVVDRVRAMVEALHVLGRPDGSLHLFNDSADGVAPSTLHLIRQGARAVGARAQPGDGVLSLPTTGYFGWTDVRTGERILLDCGDAGPAHQPGHAHCDMLSFELDLAGLRFVVDSGLSGYEGDPLREYVRSTRAHSTVSIDGEEQSELWATFRVGRRARPSAAVQRADGADYEFRGGCTPYRRQGTHYRTVLRRAGAWTITDRVVGASGSRLTSWLHIHPDWVLDASEGEFHARLGPQEVRVRPFGFDRVETIVGRGGAEAQGWFCPRFGARIAAPAIEATVLRNTGSEFGFEIQPSPGVRA